MDNLTKALLSVQQLKKAVKPVEKRTEQNRVGSSSEDFNILWNPFSKY